jgi:hypothetical protein
MGGGGLSIQPGPDLGQPPLRGHPQRPESESANRISGDGLRVGGEAAGARRGKIYDVQKIAAARRGSDRASLYEEITNQIIAELTAARITWAQPWVTAHAAIAGGAPYTQALRRALEDVPNASFVADLLFLEA